MIASLLRMYTISYIKSIVSTKRKNGTDVSIIPQGVLSSATGDPTKTRCQAKVLCETKNQVKYQVTQSSFLVRKTYISPLIIISHTRQIHQSIPQSPNPSIHPSTHPPPSRNHEQTLSPGPAPACTTPGTSAAASRT